MSHITFTPQLTTGIKAVDNDHRMLIDIVNALHDEIDAHSSASHIGSALAALIRYAEEHFAREERLMEECRYQGLAQHMRQHQQLTYTVHRIERRFKADPKTVRLSELQAFLNDWLTNHILKADLAFVPAVRNFSGGAEGEPPAVALRAVTVRVPPDRIDLILHCATLLADGGEPADRLAEAVGGAPSA